MKLLFTTYLLTFILVSFSQTEQRIAVMDPTGKVPENIHHIIREEISSTIVNTKGYTVVERSQIDKVLMETKFQEEGLVDDSHIGELGRMMGASYVCYGSVSELGSNYYISLKLVDVTTAKVLRQSTNTTKYGINDLIVTINDLTNRLILEQTDNESERVVVADTVKQTIDNSEVKYVPLAGRKNVSIAIRPYPNEENSVKLSNYFKSKVDRKFNGKIDNQDITGTVWSICKRQQRKDNDYMILITLKKQGRNYYINAEMLDINKRTRMMIPVKRSFKQSKKETEEAVYKRIWDIYRPMLNDTLAK